MAGYHECPTGKQLGIDETLLLITVTALHCNDACRYSIMRSPVRVGRYNAHRLHASELHAAEHPKLCDSMAAHHWQAC
jgi:hypothetical protein